jgi:hypothetical protein
MSGRCASQHDVEQNTSPVRLRLHVETLHTQYVAWNPISRLQLEQRRHAPVSPAVISPPFVTEILHPQASETQL